MTSEKYTNISIPKSLMLEINKVVGTRGYTSNAEFVKDASRRLLDDLKPEKEEQ